MPDSRGFIVGRNQRIVDGIEDRAVRDVARVYEQARRELIARMISAWTVRAPSPGQATALLQQLGILAEIDSRMAQLEEDTGEILRGIVIAQDEVALAAMRRETAMLKRLAGIEVSSFSSVEFALIERHLPAVLDAVDLWANSVRARLRTELQSGLVQGESFDRLIGRLMSNRPGSVWRNGRTSAELMARRTVIQANNAAKQEYIRQATAQIPEVRKQVVAVIASNTTNCCLQAHGQIQPVDKPFVLTGSPRFASEMMHTPFHWRCRSSIAMYHPSFEESGLSTDDMRQSATRELSNRG